MAPESTCAISLPVMHSYDSQSRRDRDVLGHFRIGESFVVECFPANENLHTDLLQFVKRWQVRILLDAETQFVGRVAQWLFRRFTMQDDGDFDVGGLGAN